MHEGYYVCVSFSSEKSAHFTMGYKEFMLELFGENIIFLDGALFTHAH